MTLAEKHMTESPAERLISWFRTMLELSYVFKIFVFDVYFYVHIFLKACLISW